MSGKPMSKFESIKKKSNFNRLNKIFNVVSGFIKNRNKKIRNIYANEEIKLLAEFPRKILAYTHTPTKNKIKGLFQNFHPWSIYNGECRDSRIDPGAWQPCFNIFIFF
jgi:hypothetical protein